MCRLQKDKKILLVDDEVQVRRLIAVILRRMGHEVIEVASGTEALELLGKLSVDLVVTDVNMPGLTGIDLLGKIMSTYTSLPVVVITGSISDEDALECKKFGAVDCLRKPVRIDELETVISQALEDFVQE